jgi:hypothetical protein
MSTIPYNYGKYIDDKVSMSNSGTVDAGRQAQSPASAGSRGLAKTTQFTKDPTQMKMGNSPIAESMVEIRNILNRIDGVNAPVKEDNMRDLAIHDIEAQLGKINDEITFLQIDQKDKESALAALGELRSVLDKYQSQQESAVNELADDDKIEFTKVMLDISQIKDRVEALSVDEDAKKSAIQSLTNAEEALVALDESAVREDDESYGYEWECSNCGTENEFVMTPQERAQYIKDWEADNQDLVADGETGENALNNLLDDTGEESGMHYGQKCIKCGTEAANPYQEESSDSGELARLKELSGIEEDVDMDALKKWYEKYSKYQGLNGDKLPFGLYMQMAQTGVPTDGMEAGEARQAIADQNPDIDPNDAESLAGSAEEIPDVDFEKANQPITDAMKQELMDIMGVDSIGEDEITKAMKMLGVSTGMESYEPFPEEDEMTFEDDDEFYEAFGELGFPEDETELFDAEYRGRKVPLNKPMRGDVKKFKVYVKDPKTGNVKKVNFGHGGSSARKAGQKTMKIRKSNPKARKSFRARHNCANPGPKTRARYWSCRKW